MSSVVLRDIAINPLGVGDVDQLIDKSFGPIAGIQHRWAAGKVPSLDNLEVLGDLALQKVVPADRILLVRQFEEVSIQPGERSKLAIAAVLQEKGYRSCKPRIGAM
jgi:hypothetical protein